MISFKFNDTRFLFRNILTFLYVFLTFVLFIVLGFSINRGFDFSDESCFLLNLYYPKKYPGGIYNYHLIFLHFFDFLPKSIIWFRIYGISIIFSGSIFLFFGLKKFFSSDNLPFKPRKLDVFSLSIISSFLFFFINIYTVNNNILSHFFLQVVVSILLYFFSLNEFNFTVKNYSLLFLLSIVTVFGFFNKFSSAVILEFLILVTLILLFKGKSKKKQLQLISSFLVFSSLVVYYYFTFIQSYSDWNFLFQKEMFVLSDHQPLDLIRQYFNQIKTFLFFFIKFYSWIFLYPLFYYFFIRKFLKINSKLIYLLEAIFILVYLMSLYYFKYYESTLRMGPYNHAYIYLVNIFLFLTLFIIEQKSNIRFKEILIILILFFIPFIGSIGTANNLFLNALFHGFSWVILVFFLVLKISYFRKFNLIIFSILISITVFQTLSGIIQYPYFSFSFNYGNKTTLFNENQKVNNIQLLDGVYINKLNKVFLEKLNVLFEKYHLEKRPIICYYYPGISFLMNSYSPGPNYYFSTERDAKAYSFVSNKIPPIIIEHKKISNDLIRELRRKNINFPSDYILVDSIYFYNPDSYLKIYKPNL